jgi:UDP-N-acetylmuramate dehydrogenase
MIDQKELQETLKDIYQGQLLFSIPMKDYTSLAIGGLVEVLACPDDPLSMRNLITVLGSKTIPFIPFGGGTNVLVRDGGIAGAVILTRTFNRMELIREGNENVELFVEAGVPWQRLVNYCKEKGYSGIEGLTGIPGSVGGAVCGNAGSFGYEVTDVLSSVAIMDARGRFDRFKAEGLGFGYRRSDISENDLVLSANMKLKRDEKEAVSMRTDAFFRERKGKQPISERSAGCVFKNPEGASAGKLIDEAGCKGMRIGGIEVSSVHANFFVNRGQGSSADYINLMNEVVSMVQKQFGISLESEIKIVGRNL